MKKITAVLLLIIFTLWLVPLGAYIDVAREDILCNGRRAVCLCSKNFKSSKKDSSTKQIATTSTSLHKRSLSSRQGTQSFVFQPHVAILSLTKTGMSEDFLSLPKDRYLRPIDHIPKV